MIDITISYRPTNSHCWLRYQDSAFSLEECWTVIEKFQYDNPGVDMSDIALEWQ